MRANLTTKKKHDTLYASCIQCTLGLLAFPSFFHSFFNKLQQIDIPMHLHPL